MKTRHHCENDCCVWVSDGQSTLLTCCRPCLLDKHWDWEICPNKDFTRVDVGNWRNYFASHNVQKGCRYKHRKGTQCLSCKVHTCVFRIHPMKTNLAGGMLLATLLILTNSKSWLIPFMVGKVAFIALQYIDASNHETKSVEGSQQLAHLSGLKMFKEGQQAAENLNLLPVK